MLRLNSQKLQLRQQSQPMDAADMEQVESEITRVRCRAPLALTPTPLAFPPRALPDPSPPNPLLHPRPHTRARRLHGRSHCARGHALPAPTPPRLASPSPGP